MVPAVGICERQTRSIYPQNRDAATLVCLKRFVLTGFARAGLLGPAPPGSQE